MRAIVPLNVAGLRVSNADATNVTNGAGFAGRTAVFDNLPHGSAATQASTGDQVWRPLAQPPAEALPTGIHLHWELPEFFKRGHQDPDTHKIIFPAAPNRWLVSRTLRIWDTNSSTYGPPQATSWIVESDYVSPVLTPDGHGVTRLPVAVPLPGPNHAPYQFMGRVVDAADWQPDTEPATSYLPAFRGPDQAPLYLTSIGFAGAAFSGYYPDCRSVFGFWDCFDDVAAVYAAISRNLTIQFAASYSVTGWLGPEATDPLAGLAAQVTTAYDRYVAQCATERVPVVRTPRDVFHQITGDQFGWLFSDEAITFTLHEDSTLASLTAPSGTLCAGTLVDVVWAGSTPFLAPPGETGAWTDQVQIAAGNTTVEAVAALIAGQLTPPVGANPAIVSAYEVLLEALQLGLLRDLESDGNALITLGRARHDKGFSAVDGGHLWTIRTAATPGSPGSTDLTLPLTLAEQLDVLNLAQQAYDRARDRLVTLRQQLFMDWITFVKQFVVTGGRPVVPTNALIAFLTSASTGELAAVSGAGAATGLIDYTVDADTGHIIGVGTTDPAQTLAGQLVAAYQVVAHALAGLGQPWVLDAVPAPAYWMPTDPVLVIEGDRIEPVRRNGPGLTIAVRTDAELIVRLAIATAAGTWTVPAAQLSARPPVPAATPAEVGAVVGEAMLLDPQRAAGIAAATPASDQAALTTALAAAVGGQSPLDPPVSPGLFAAVRAAGSRPAANPTQTVESAGTQVSVTFTNPGAGAYAPDPVGWNTQNAWPEFSATRVDPYLPVWMTWTGRLDPLKPAGANGSYATTQVIGQFGLDESTLDFDYAVPASFTTGALVDYTGEVVLSKTPMVSLTQQIDGYLAEFAGDPADPELIAARDDLAGRKVMSQALDTFNLAQTLRQTIPQIALVDLVKSPDAVTAAIARAAGADPADSWYATSFNSLQPVSTGPQALANFGPLRAGFLELRALSLVDVFGQRLTLLTATGTPSGALTVRAAGTLAPAPGDAVNAARLYLPPRVLTPTRLEAHWLSAAHNDDVAGVSEDFLESNDHPATSPVCGWLLPNHLDVSLMCYDADGRAIGSFARVGNNLRYQTRAGNLANPISDLAVDIGPPPTAGPPPTRPVNAHVAEVMWFISGQPAAFLTDLLAAIERAGTFIAPSRATQDISTSVLLGQPLALVRMALGLSTAGGTLPVSQANTSPAGALAQVVSHTWSGYADRQAGTSAALGQVEFAVALGEETDLDDGLVAFLPEGSGAGRYGTVYSPAAPDDGDPVLIKPSADTLTFTLNSAASFITALVDPRAPVHLTSGILPTTTLQIPPDQYAQAMQQLGVTFTTRPVLGDGLGLRLPLPTEPGYRWAWVAPGLAPVPLDPAVQPDTPVYGHGPHTLAEGWLLLQPDPAAQALRRSRP